MFDASAFNRRFRWVATKEWWRVWGLNVILGIWFLISIIYVLKVYLLPTPTTPSGF